MSKPDLSTVLNTALSHAATDADAALSNALNTAMSHAPSSTDLPGLAELMPQTQGLPSGHDGAADHTPDAHAVADVHAGGGIIDHAGGHADGTLPDLTSLTGHDWFVHM